MIGSSDPWFTGSKKPVRSRLKEGLEERVVQVDTQDNVRPKPWLRIVGYIVLVVALVGLVGYVWLLSIQQPLH